MNERKIQEARQRAFRYYYEDGLVEIAVGAMFSVIGLLLWLYERVLAGGQYAWVLGIGLMAATVGGVFAVRRLVLKLKSELTYPRTGRVIYSEKAGRTGRWLLIAAALALAVGLLWVPGWLNTTATAAGGLLTIILLYMGSTVSLVRMQVAAVLPIAVGVLASYYGVGEILGFVAVFASSGVLLLVLGLLALRGYLARNPYVDDREV